MKTTLRSRFCWPRHGKALVALIAVCGVAGSSMVPAHAEGNDKRDEHHDQGNHKGEKHDDRNRNERERPRYEQPRFYPQPVYAPPVVYYPPQQSPGISLFLPLDIHIR
jgi:Ni/Co efflux regulator RcnB